MIITIDQIILEILRDADSFTRKDLLDVMHNCGLSVSDASFRYKLQKLISSGHIASVGHNAYYIARDNIHKYQHDYSEQAKSVITTVTEKYPKIKISIFELMQLNEFVNHQLAHNIIFASIESNFGEFVFDALKETHPGRVLIYPSPDMFHQYWHSNMIVIRKLVTEAPKDKKRPWAARLEKILVDIIADPLIVNSISESEYPNIYEDAFQKYAVNESCLFRYAKRRGVDNEILQLIKDGTQISLRTRRV